MVYIEKLCKDMIFIALDCLKQIHYMLMFDLPITA